MRYIIFFDGQPPFYTKYFDDEEIFRLGMTVIDMNTDHYTTDGVEWVKIEVGHL